MLVVSSYSLFCIEKLDHIPGSYIVLMVHMVKGRQYSAYSLSHIYVGASITEMKSETDSRLRISMLQSKEILKLDSIVQLPNFRSVVA